MSCAHTLMGYSEHMSARACMHTSACTCQRAQMGFHIYCRDWLALLFTHRRWKVDRSKPLHSGNLPDLSQPRLNQSYSCKRMWVCGSSHVKASPVVKTNTPLSALPEQTNKQCMTHVMHCTIDLDLITGVLLGQSRLLL